MRTLLILTKQPLLAAAIQAVLDQTKFQIVAKEDVWEAELLLARGAIDASILDVELTDVRAVRLIEEMKNCAPGCPILIYTGAKQNEWEEDAYMLGVSHVLTKPVRGKLLNMLLDRCFSDVEPQASPGGSRTSPGAREDALFRRPHARPRGSAPFFRHPGAQPRCRFAAQAIPPSAARDHRREPRHHFPAQASVKSPEAARTTAGCAPPAPSATTRRFSTISPSRSAGASGAICTAPGASCGGQPRNTHQPRDRQGIPASRRAGRHPHPRPRIAHGHGCVSTSV